MKVRVKLFAVAKELAGRDALVVDVSENATVGEVKGAVVTMVPELSRIASHALWAIGTEYVAADARVSANSDVAMIPPVSGG